MGDFWFPRMGGNSGSNPPKLNAEESKGYAVAMIRYAIKEALGYRYMWRRYLKLDDRNNYFVYAKLSSSDKVKVAEEISGRLYDMLAIARAYDANLNSGLRSFDVTKDKIQSMALECIMRKASEEERDIEVKEQLEANVQAKNGAESGGVILARSMAMEISKGLGDYRDSNFVPEKFDDRLSLVSYGKIPKGYVVRSDVEDICPELAKSMEVQGLPIVKESFLGSVVAEEAVDFVRSYPDIVAGVLELSGNAMDFVLDHPDASEYDCASTFKSVAIEHFKAFGEKLEGWSMDDYEEQVKRLGEWLGVEGDSGRDIVKAFGRKKTEELTRKKIINKRGILQTILVREGDLPKPEKKKGVLGSFFSLISAKMKSRGHEIHDDVAHHLFVGWNPGEGNDHKALARNLLDHIHAIISNRKSASRSVPPGSRKPADGPKRTAPKTSKPDIQVHIGNLKGKALRDLVESLIAIGEVSGEDAAKYRQAASGETPEPVPKMGLAGAIGKDTKPERAYDAKTEADKARKTRQDSKKGDGDSEKAENTAFKYPDSRPKPEDVKGDVTPKLLVGIAQDFGIKGAKVWNKSGKTRIYLNEGGYGSAGYGFITVNSDGGFSTSTVSDDKRQVAEEIVALAKERAQEIASERVSSYEKFHNLGATVRHMGTPEQGVDVVEFGNKVAIQEWRNGVPQGFKITTFAPKTLPLSHRYGSAPFVPLADLLKDAEKAKADAEKSAKRVEERKGKKLSSDHKPVHQLVQESDASPEYKAFFSRIAAVEDRDPLDAADRDALRKRRFNRLNEGLKSLSPHDRALAHKIVSSMASKGKDSIVMGNPNKELIKDAVEGYEPEDSAEVSKVVYDFTELLGAYNPKNDSPHAHETLQESKKIGAELKAAGVDDVEVNHWTTDDAGMARIYFNSPKEWTGKGRRRRLESTGPDYGYAERKPGGDWKVKLDGPDNSTRKRIEGVMNAHVTGDVTPSKKNGDQKPDKEESFKTEHHKAYSDRFDEVKKNYMADPGFMPGHNDKTKERYANVSANAAALNKFLREQGISISETAIYNSMMRSPTTEALTKESQKGKLKPEDMLEKYLMLNDAGEITRGGRKGSEPESERVNPYYRDTKPSLKDAGAEEQVKEYARENKLRLGSKKYDEHVAKIGKKFRDNLKKMAMDKINEHINSKEEDLAGAKERAKAHKEYAEHLKEHADNKDKLMEVAIKHGLDPMNQAVSSAVNHRDELREKAKAHEIKADSIQGRAERAVEEAKNIKPEDVISESFNEKDHPHVIRFLQGVSGERPEKPSSDKENKTVNLTPKEKLEAKIRELKNAPDTPLNRERLADAEAELKENFPSREDRDSRAKTVLRQLSDAKASLDRLEKQRARERELGAGKKELAEYTRSINKTKVSIKSHEKELSALGVSPDGWAKGKERIAVLNGDAKEVDAQRKGNWAIREDKGVHTVFHAPSGMSVGEFHSEKAAKHFVNKWTEKHPEVLDAGSDVRHGSEGRKAQREISKNLGEALKNSRDTASKLRADLHSGREIPEGSKPDKNGIHKLHGVEPATGAPSYILRGSGEDSPTVHITKEKIPHMGRMQNEHHIRVYDKDGKDIAGGRKVATTKEEANKIAEDLVNEHVLLGTNLNGPKRALLERIANPREHGGRASLYPLRGTDTKIIGDLVSAGLVETKPDATSESNPIVVSDEADPYSTREKTPAAQKWRPARITEKGKALLRHISSGTK